VSRAYVSRRSPPRVVRGLSQAPGYSADNGRVKGITDIVERGARACETPRSE